MACWAHRQFLAVNGDIDSTAEVVEDYRCGETGGPGRLEEHVWPAGLEIGCVDEGPFVGAVCDTHVPARPAGEGNLEAAGVRFWSQAPCWRRGLRVARMGWWILGWRLRRVLLLVGLVGLVGLLVGLMRVPVLRFLAPGRGSIGRTSVVAHFGVHID